MRSADVVYTALGAVRLGLRLRVTVKYNGLLKLYIPLDFAGEPGNYR